MRSSIHGPAITSVIPVTTIFGTKVSVISWISVAAWRIDTARPTIRLAARNGSASSKPSSIAFMARWMATSPFTASGVERVDEALDGQGPAVDQDEQQDLERERDE